MRDLHVQSVPVRERRAVVAMIAALAGAAFSANADTVLYESRSMAIDGTWDSRRTSLIGGFAWYGGMRDHQVADDFTVLSAVELTRVTADFWHNTLLASPADGWLVEVFADEGGKPSETPTHAVWGASGVRLGSFGWTGGGGFGSSTPDQRSTFEIDLSGEGVSLGAGTWWISVVAVDESPFGGVYQWVGGRSVLNGSVAHARDGGIAHGNGYNGPDSIPFEWTAMTTSSSTNSRPYEMSMMIAGNLIPAPASLCVLAMSGLAMGVRRRR